MDEQDAKSQLRFSVLFFLRFTVVGATFPMMSLWVRDVWGGKDHAGLFMSTIALMSILSHQFWGYMGDMVITRKRVMLINLAAGMTLLAISSTLGSFKAFLAVWACIAFFMTPINPMMNAMVMGSPSLSRNYPRIRSWGTVGFIVANLAVGFLADRLGDRRIAFYAGCTGGMLAWVWVWFIHAPQPMAPRRIPFLQVQRLFLTKRHFVWFLLALFLNRMAHGAMMLFQSFRAEELAAPGAESRAALFIFVVGALAELPVFFFGRGLIARFGLLQLLMWSSGLAVVRFLIVPVVGYWGLVATQLLHAFTFGLYYLAGVSWMNRHTPPEVRTSGQTIFNLVWFGLAPMFGHVIFGTLYEHFGGGHLTLLFHGGSLIILLSMMLLANAMKAEPSQPMESVPFPGESSVNQ